MKKGKQVSAKPSKKAPKAGAVGGKKISKSGLFLQHLPIFLVPLSYTAASPDSPDSTKEDSAAVVSLLKQIKTFCSSSDGPELKSPLASEPSKKSGPDVITQCTNDLHRLLFRRPSCSMSITNLDLIAKTSAVAADAAMASGGVHMRFIKLLLKKSTNTFPILITALKCERVALNPCSVASLLTLLYNLLKCLPLARVAKAVHTCERSNLSRACGTILHNVEAVQTYVATDHTQRATLRCVEAASLLYAMAGLYNSKVILMVRLTKDLGAIASVLDNLAALLEASFAKYNLPDGIDDMGPQLAVLKEVKTLHSPLLKCIVHTSLSLFSLSKGANNAQELGVNFSATCVKRVELLCKTIRTIKKHAISISTSVTGPLPWLAEWLKQLRAACFWQLALFHRMCSCPALRSRATEEAVQHNFLCHCVEILTESCSFSKENSTSAGPPTLEHSVAATNYYLEFTHIVLLCLAEMLVGNRTITLEEFDKVGGLGRIVDLLMTCKETKLSLWQQFYMRTAGLYGVSALPAQIGQEGCALDQRRPLRQTYSTGTPKGADSDEVRAKEPQLLPVDINAAVFSPELRSTTGSGFTLPLPLPPANAIHLPRDFTSVPAPQTAHLYTNGGTAIRDEEDHAPLSEPTEEDRVQVLQQQLNRFRLLDEKHHDSIKGQEHVYNIVYERDVMVNADECRFDSDFECGNLKRAIKVTEREYDLVLSWDTTTNSFTQWFYFSIENYVPGATYRLNILNMEKGGSTFNEGQRPLMFHVKERGVAPQAGANWRRVGSKIYYFRNRYARPERARLDDAVKSKVTKNAANQEGGKKKGAKPKGKKTAKAAPRSSAVTQYFTLSFEVTMPKEGGVVYLCNCYPYSYTELCTHLRALDEKAAANHKLSPLFVQNLCESLGGLPVPLVTLTARFNKERNAPYTEEEIAARPVCFLDARVHPGETNSSWVMQGVLDALLMPQSTAANDLLTSYVFKVIPMINVDGVVMGNHRCSFAGMDLNRDYLHPSPEDNPVIYSMKQLMRHMLQVEGRRIVVYADFHGHSREQDFLVYGCTQETIKGLGEKGAVADESSKAPDQIGGSPEKFFPMLLRLLCPTFSLAKSNFAVQKSKRGSARVVMYKELGIPMSFGFEGTMMGGSASSFHCDWTQPYEVVPSDAFKGRTTHYSQSNYLTFGNCFVKALHLFCLHDRDVLRLKESGAGGTIHPIAQRAWCMVQEAGTGKLATGEEADRKPVLMSASSSQEVVAGPYALATRSERRCESSWTVAEETTDGVAAKAAMLEYLMRRGEEGLLIEREDVTHDGEEEGEEDDPDEWLTQVRNEQDGETETEGAGNATDTSGLPEAAEDLSSSSTSDADDIAEDEMAVGDAIVVPNDADDFFESTLPPNVLLL